MWGHYLWKFYLYFNWGIYVFIELLLKKKIVFIELGFDRRIKVGWDTRVVTSRTFGNIKTILYIYYEYAITHSLGGVGIPRHTRVSAKTVVLELPLYSLRSMEPDLCNPFSPTSKYAFLHFSISLALLFAISCIFFYRFVVSFPLLSIFSPSDINQAGIIEKRIYLFHWFLLLLGVCLWLMNALPFTLHFSTSFLFIFICVFKELGN